MTPEQWARVKDMFDAALERPPEERSEFLEGACAGDELIRGEVKRLLAYDRASGFLDSPAWSNGAEAVFAPESDGPVAAVAIAPPVSMVLKAEEIFAHRYEVQGELGRGGFGVVYSAFDQVLKRTVALKVILLTSGQPSGLADSARQRFLEEARIAGNLSHSNIATVFDVGESAGFFYMTQELAPGRDLGKILAEGGALPLRRSVAIARQICEGLDHAHARKVVHRDIKPGNIIVSEDDRVKVTDFGLAQSPQDEDSALNQAIAGTPGYMAPEQFARGHVDGRADIFAVGCVLYQMLTARKPFAGATPVSVIQNTLNAVPLTPSQVRRDLPRTLDRIVARAMRKNPEERYQTITELQRDLIKYEPGARRRWRAAAAALALLMAFGAALYFRKTDRPPALTEKDTIVLADFTNTTGDSVFDGTLRQGLSAQLEQSPFVNLLSDTRIAQTLALMTKPRDARLTPELAREVCQRTASTATIDGSIASLGGQYVLGLKAVNCHNGETLAEEQEIANGKEQVLRALGDAATKMRKKLGESLVSVEKYDVPPENVTTPSLAALQAYSIGYREQIITGDPVAATAPFQRAIALDPNFAMAYARLGMNFANLSETVRAEENTRRAYELRDRVSAREQFYITSHYEHYVTGNLDAARKAYELWLQTYPRDEDTLNNLSIIYLTLGEYAKGLAISQEILKLDPGSGQNYSNLVTAYMSLNRLQEARATAREAQARNLDSPPIHTILYWINFLEHDAGGMAQEAAELMGKPGYEDWILDTESDTAAYYGKFFKARTLTQRAVDSALHADAKETAAGYQAEAAAREALVGNEALARKQARSAMALSNGKDGEDASAVALALADDSAGALRLAKDLDNRFLGDTMVQSEYLPAIRAASILGTRPIDADHAIETLVTAESYELGSDPTVALQFFPPYLRGQAYLAVRQGSAAAAEFQKILDNPGIVGNELIGALAHLGIARAYALEAGLPMAAVSDRRKQNGAQRAPLQTDALTKARGAYQDFFNLWKDADPDIPILKQAKAEYARLQEEGGP